MKGQKIEVTDWGKVMGKDCEIVCGEKEVREVWKNVLEDLLSRPSVLVNKN